MDEIEKKNLQDPEDTCPCCPRHCPLTATSCEKGAAYAKMTPEEREANHESHDHGDHGERGGHDGHHHGRGFHGHGDDHGRGHGHRGGF